MDESILNYAEFWSWFLKHEKSFHDVVKNNGDIERDFFEKLAEKLDEMNEGFFFLAGMCDENTAELVFTADGNPKYVVFAEEIVSHAPQIDGWQFTALKQGMGDKNFAVKLEEFEFDENNLFFYANDDERYPDEINICIAHKDRNNENQHPIDSGAYVYIDAYLGELDFLQNIDSVRFINMDEAEKELIPISKLKSYLIWRQKEFVEKYDNVFYEKAVEDIVMIDATLENGFPVCALINNALVDWEYKASHPWIVKIEITYEGMEENGLPDFLTLEVMTQFDDDLLTDLDEVDGYLYLCNETADGSRELYFACKDFRLLSKVVFINCKNFESLLDIDYRVYKDKYWRSLDWYYTSASRL